ncbi:MAG TPA: sensor histidine kinase [Candidatus Limnocylindrales bacterium]|nr:sensor histidine kinase [Candidatus Limnocylindrales bacterium]
MSGPYTPNPMEGGGDAFAKDDVAASTIEALDAERARIGREIHDGPAQALANAIFLVDDIERQVESAPGDAIDGLRRLRSLLRREIANIRDFISELRPPLVDAAGLDVALRDAAESLRATTSLLITTDLRAPGDLLDDRQRTVVLRVAQEALQNVRKHAGASTVSVVSDVADDGWTLEIRDDGRGFDLGTVAARGRRNFGMQVMHERAELIGARFDVRSRPDGGTVVRLAIPTGARSGAKENG